MTARRAHARVVQFTDTHVVERGRRVSDRDTGAHLADAIRAANALEPDYAIVTGDLVDDGRAEQYEHFREIMRALDAPYFAIPGNHDDPIRLREILGGTVVPSAPGERSRFTIDAFPIRTIALDVTKPRPAPGAAMDELSFAWLELMLAGGPTRPTLLAVHQPPFRTGLWFLDAFGFGGARRLRKLVERSPQIGRVICGHVHCVRTSTWKHALATSAPSTSPQRVPEIFETARVARLRSERAGFAVHDWSFWSGFRTTVYRRGDDGTVVAAETPAPR